MRYPPAMTFTPAASWVYRSVACLVTLILIALYAVSAMADGLFSLKSGVFLMLALMASCWLLRDAWKRPQGSLHFAQGQWCARVSEQEIVGTCTLHLDLQAYMLVSFRAHPSDNKHLVPRTQWFQLEARHEDPAAGKQAWLSLRRALYASTAPTAVLGDAELALTTTTNAPAREQRAA